MNNGGRPELGLSIWMCEMDVGAWLFSGEEEQPVWSIAYNGRCLPPTLVDSSATSKQLPQNPVRFKAPHTDRQAGFPTHFASCSSFVAFAALDPTTGRHMSDPEEASFVLDDRSSGNAIALQGVGHIWSLHWKLQVLCAFSRSGLWFLWMGHHCCNLREDSRGQATARWLNDLLGSPGLLAPLP